MAIPGFFMQVLVIGTQVPMLAPQTFYPQSHLPSPVLSLLTFLSNFTQDNCSGLSGMSAREPRMTLNAGKTL